MAGTSTYISSGSKPLIKNTPSPLVYTNYVLTNAPQILAEAVNEAVSEEIEYLQDSLPQEHPEYREIAEFFGITYDPKTSSFVYVVDDKYADRARLIEYGSPQQPPSAVLRNAARNGAERLTSSINSKLAKALGR